MKTKAFYIKILLLFLIAIGHSQSNNQTFTPYSLFGLGSFNNSNTGITNAFGNNGIALESVTEINNLNPASLASIKTNSFLFDSGVKAKINDFQSANDGDRKTALSFSNLSFAFSVDEKSGVSLSLIPFTEVGYVFNNIINRVEGANEVYYSTVVGNGGLNNLNLSYGRIIDKNIRVGIGFNYYFGTIKQSEIVSYNSDLLSIVEDNFYNGVRFTYGYQQKLNEKFTIATVLKLPTRLSGSKNRKVLKLVNDVNTIIEDDSNLTLVDFNIPFEFNFGFKFQQKQFQFLADYSRVLWNSVNTSDNIGTYVTSNRIGFGGEYGYKYLNKLNLEKKLSFRLGFSYDDGFLKVNNSTLDSYTLTSGIGIPFGQHNSFFNISYSYGSAGRISNTLVRENTHSLSLNFSFEDIWFIKSKFD
ncbi:hypothetical protein [Yeosuana sp.]|uniref:hypothetical protein n=1 Tax=Yeosuana sp. TaxID=2529388 RepID=UPI00404AC5AD